MVLSGHDDGFRRDLRHQWRRSFPARYAAPPGSTAPRLDTGACRCAGTIGYRTNRPLDRFLADRGGSCRAVRRPPTGSEARKGADGDRRRRLVDQPRARDRRADAALPGCPQLRGLWADIRDLREQPIPGPSGVVRARPLRPGDLGAMAPHEVPLWTCVHPRELVDRTNLARFTGSRHPRVQGDRRIGGWARGAPHRSFRPFHQTRPGVSRGASRRDESGDRDPYCRRRTYRRAPDRDARGRAGARHRGVAGRTRGDPIVARGSRHRRPHTGLSHEDLGRPHPGPLDMVALSRRDR